MVEISDLSFFACISSDSLHKFCLHKNSRKSDHLQIANSEQEGFWADQLFAKLFSGNCEIVLKKVEEYPIRSPSAANTCLNE